MCRVRGSSGTVRDADAIDLPTEQRRRAVALEQRVLDRRRTGVQREQVILQT
jgi:hypothetical protein